MIDPTKRWAKYGEKPDYAGLLTFAGKPYTEDAADLVGADVVVIGAPTDDLVSDRPGARFGPRAIRAASCPPGPHLEVGVDALAELKVIDYGDAPVVPADPQRKVSNQAIEDLVSEVHAAGAIPVVLGGDHGVTLPEVRAAFKKHGPVGLIHFDTHADTGEEVFGATVSHGSPMFQMVQEGIIDASRYVQIGLRGYWPGEEVFQWQRSHGISSFFAHEIRDRGIKAVMADAIKAAGSGPTIITVDVDVLDPAFAPGTGTPEPGGLTSSELLWACREAASKLDVVGADVVEVLPTAVGSADLAALVAERTIREVLTGIAMRRANKG